MSRISLDQIHFAYPKQEPLFEDLSLMLGGTDNEGHITALMGSSGSGKTTLLKLLLGILKPQRGSVHLQPQESVISYVPQEPVLFEHLTPMENARYFSYASKLKNRFSETQFEHLIDLLEIGSVITQRKNVQQLSGGQRQRLSLLRALSIQPDILLLDEPCTGLDAEVKLAFMAKLHELVTELNLFAIYVTHHIDEAQFVAKNVAFQVKDSLSGRITSISNQAIEEFLIKPPSLEALRLTRFPQVNILGLADESGLPKLSSSPHYYIVAEAENIKLVDDGSGLCFEKLFENGVYSCYQHKESKATITFSASSGIAAARIQVQISGNFACYRQNGVYDNTVVLEIV